MKMKRKMMFSQKKEQKETKDDDYTLILKLLCSLFLVLVLILCPSFLILEVWSYNNSTSEKQTQNYGLYTCVQCSLIITFFFLLLDVST
jgi:ABC-type phosphate transport system permease subunit